VFKVGGTISISEALIITKPNITIAGETAPGGGIAVKGTGTTEGVLGIERTENIIMRHIRLRGGPTDDKAGIIEIIGGVNIIVDHVSISWSVDENLAMTNSRNITIQNSIVAEPLNCTIHYEGGCHSKSFFGYYRIATNLSNNSYDDIFENISVYNNFIAHGGDRNPRFRVEATGQSKDRNVEVVNNVMYNFGGTGGAPSIKELLLKLEITPEEL